MHKKLVGLCQFVHKIQSRAGILSKRTGKKPKLDHVAVEKKKKEKKKKKKKKKKTGKFTNTCNPKLGKVKTMDFLKQLQPET